MAHAEICPICGGKGVIEKETNTTIGKVKKVCHGCGGKGWIEVRDEYPFYYEIEVPTDNKIIKQYITRIIRT